MRESPIVRFFVERFVFSTAAFLTLVLFGLLAARGLGVDLLPKFEFPVVAISTAYPGAGPEEIESQISKPIEEALSTLSGIDQIASQSSEGFSLVIAQFKYGTSVNQAATDVSQRIAAVRGQLPRDAEAPVVQKFDPAAQPILSVAVSAEGRDLRTVADWVENQLKPRLQLVSGVADLQVEGNPKRQVQVLVDPWKLADYGLSASQVVAAVQASALAVPAGSQEQDGQRLLYSLRNQPQTAADVTRIVVDPNRGLKIADVASVRDTQAEATRYTRLSGQPIVLLNVRKTPDANAVAVAQGIKKTLANTSLPSGYRVSITNDTTTFIEATVNDTWKEVFLVVGVVSFIVLIFLGKLNSVFSVVLAIPITLAGALLIFGLLGFTFNIISLLAIIVAVGIVVDDSIVVAENIDRYRRQNYSLPDAVMKATKGFLSREDAAVLTGHIARYQAQGYSLHQAVSKGSGELLSAEDVQTVTESIEAYLSQPYSLKDAVLKGTTEVLSAVSAATLSLLAVFLPISFLPGAVGQFFREFGLVLAAAIFFSWLEALFFLTVRLAYLPDPIPPSWQQVGKRARDLGGDLRWAIRSEIYRDSQLPFSAKLFNAILTPFRLVLAPLRWLAALVGGILGAATLSLHTASEYGFDRLRNSYARSLAWLLPRSPWVLLAGILFFLSIAWVAPQIPFNFTPKSDGGIINIRLKLPKGTALSQTDRLTRRLEDYLLAQPYVKEVLTEVGASSTGIGTGNPERSSLTVNLVDKHQRENIYAIVPKLDTQLQNILADHPEAELKVKAAEGGPGGDDFQFTLSAPTQALLEERNNRALEILKSIPALTNISSSLAEKTAERVLVPNQAALVGTGLTPSDLAQVLRICNAGVEAGKLRAGGEETPIVVKADPTLVPDQNALQSLPVFSQTLRQSLPLSLLSSFESRQSPATLARNNQAFSTGITANLAPGASGGVLQYSQQIQRELERQGVLKDGVRLESTGGTAFAGDLFEALPIAFGLSVLLNYLVIASQFNTFRYPIYLLVPIPLALVGAFWALFLFRSGLDVVSVLGLVLLNGLVTKNAILLLDFAVRQAREKPLFDALVEAARLRLRPILMTTLTVLIISIPLILASGEGSEFRKPLGIIILGGVTTSTFLTLFVVPAAFYLFERRRYAKLQQEAQLTLVPAGD